MTTLLDPNAADRLAKLCGMFGSNHDGERATAAALADRLLRQQGLTWGDVIIAKPARSTVEEQIDFALHHGEGLLDVWQERFLRGICGRQFLTKKQLLKLEEIVAIVSRRATA